MEVCMQAIYLRSDLDMLKLANQIKLLVII